MPFGGTWTTLAFAFVSLLAISASGDTSSETTNRQLCGQGLLKEYPPSKEGEVIKVLRKHLCPNNRTAMTDGKENGVHKLECRTITREKQILDGVMRFVATPWRYREVQRRLNEVQEATPYAAMAVREGKLKVVLGVRVRVNDKPAKAIDDKFFDPTEWADGVWTKLAPLME